MTMQTHRGGEASDVLPRLGKVDRSRVHVFNSFFLKRLKSALSANQGLECLLKWVKGVDLLGTSAL